MPIIPDDAPILSMTPEAIARFWARVDKSAGPHSCHLWRGGSSSDGYGRFCTGVKRRRSHRVAYILLRGLPPADRPLLDHACRNKLCCNPSHLHPCTNKENILRGVGPCALNAAKTHCAKGHEFTAANTHVYRNLRICRICKAAAHKRRQDALRTRYSAVPVSRPEKEALCLELKRNGSYFATAIAYGVSPRTIARWCRAYGIERVAQGV